MALKGDLASVDLAQVFQMLALNQKVGLLGIQSPMTWRALYFDARGVTLYYNEHTLLDRVLSNMTRSGRITGETVSEARDHAAQMGMSIVDSLLAGGYLTEAELQDMFRVELEEDIYDLFFWNDARFEFFEGATSFEGREGCVNDTLFFSTDSLIMEAARRIDEWSYIGSRISGPSEVLTATGAAAQVTQLDDTSLSVFDLVDGKRNVARIVEASGLPAFHVYKALSTLMDGGLVDYLPPNALLAQGDTCLVEGRVKDAINLFEKAVECGEGLPSVHDKASQAYHSAEEYEQAVYHLRCLAEYEATQENYESAVQHLEEAIKILPTDLASRERLVELGISAGVSEGAFEAGRELVDLYMEIGEVERVRGILEGLVRENPDDIELKKILVNVHTKTGDQKRVIELYESMAQDLVAAGQTIEAVSCLQKILRLDRSRTDINDKIRSLYRLDERRRSRRRSLGALAFLFLLVASLGGAYLFYDQRARDAFELIDVVALVEAEQFGEAEKVYETFASTYPFSTASVDADGERHRIAGLRLAQQARMERARRDRDKALEKVRASYKLAHRRYKDEFNGGSPEQALATLEEVIRLATEETGDEADLKWLSHNGVPAAHRQLRDWLGTASALERNARKKLDAGDWRAARALYVDLVQNYELTRTAQMARIPVYVTSRPAGAAIQLDGTPLTERVGDQDVPVTTPAVVLMRAGSTPRMSMVLEGFDSLNLTVNPLEAEIVARVMQVQPLDRFSFRSSAETGVAAGRGAVAVGIKGGRVGVARLSSGEIVGEARLPGLSSVMFSPVIAGDRFYYLTNNREVASHHLADGSLADGWPRKLQHDPAFPLVVQDGRMLIVDDQGRVTCLDPRTGKTNWMRPLDAQAAGTPTIHRRQVLVGTADGRIVRLDATNGKSIGKVVDMPGGAGVTTRIWPLGSRLVCGCTDGFVRAFDARGRMDWAVNLDRAADDNMLVVGSGALLALKGSTTLVRIDPDSGNIAAESEITGSLVPPLAVSGGRLAVVLRIMKEGKDAASRKSIDVLSVRSVEDLSPVWEYRDGGTFAGPVTVDESRIYLPVSSGEVVTFR